MLSNPYGLTKRQLLANSIRLRCGIDQPTREAVRQVACPYCRAAPGTPCIGRGGKVRKGNHVERTQLFIGDAPNPALRPYAA